MAKFCNLFSGSKGNCTYIEGSDGGILIDAGKSAKQITDKLASFDIDTKKLCGVFITHEHSDHISALRVLIKRLKLPVYATKGTLDELIYREIITIDDAHEIKIGQTVECANLEVSAFSTSHDAAQSCGYTVKPDADRKIAICTDLGYISDEVISAISGSNLIMLESNHDIRMLENGSYPYPLKQRILGQCGHLSNDAASEILPNLVKGGATEIFLAHLSEENNYPDIAKMSAVNSLAAEDISEGRDCLLNVLAPSNTTGVTYL